MPDLEMLIAAENMEFLAKAISLGFADDIPAAKLQVCKYVMASKPEQLARIILCVAKLVEEEYSK